MAERGKRVTRFTFFFLALTLVCAYLFQHQRKLIQSTMADFRILEEFSVSYESGHHVVDDDAMDELADGTANTASTTTQADAPGSSYEEDGVKGTGTRWIPNTKAISPKEGKPSFVIHVGPSKLYDYPQTASTTMQADLGKLQLESVLEQDDYVYLGLVRRRHRKSMIQKAFSNSTCLKAMQVAHKRTNTTTFANVPCWQTVAQEIKEWRKQNKSILLSSELVSNIECPLWNLELFHIFLTALKEALGDDWNTYVVVTYRRYGEWVLSSAKQFYGIRCMGPQAEWSAARLCEDVWSLIERWMNRPSPGGKNFHYFDTVISHWWGHFPIRMLNYHADGHITQKLVCDVLQDAPHTCEFTRNRVEPEPMNVRTSMTTAYKNIAMGAYQKGWIRTSHSPAKFVLEMEDQLQGKLCVPFHRLPLVCPSYKKLEKLLQISLKFERKWLPDWYNSSQGELAHREAFWTLSEERGEYCSVDVGLVLKDKNTWEEVLEGLVSQEEPGALVSNKA